MYAELELQVLGEITSVVELTACAVSRSDWHFQLERNAMKEVKLELLLPTHKANRSSVNLRDKKDRYVSLNGVPATLIKLCESWRYHREKYEEYRLPESDDV
jgi:hypothetical protein